MRTYILATQYFFPPYRYSVPGEIPAGLQGEYLSTYVFRNLLYERNRNIDAYLPTRRIFESEIIIQIPDNYTVGDVEHLNVSFSNEYGTFEAVSIVENNTITIKTKKMYHQAFIPKEDWGQLIEILDKANRFYSGAVILQKVGE